MTVTVVATPTAKTKRRDPLTTINMATSQAQARPASSATGKAGRKGTRSSARLSLNSQEKSEENSTRGKRKGSFDDDDDDFQFTRIKKSKPAVETIPELPQSVPEKAAPQPSPKRGRPPKKRPAEKSEAVAEANHTTESRTKRSTRGAARGTAKPAAPEPEAQTQAQSQPQTQTQTQPESATRSTRNRDHTEPVPKEKAVPKEKEKKKRRGRPSKSNEPERQNGFVSPEPQKTGTATIALPMADTPVIQRNKEMRGQTKAGKGNRRSSLGMRGRRASSLIDSGASNALPHKEVGTAEFYKHIASDGLPEPRRMRQLLTWCATRAMGAKPSGSGAEDASVHLAARVIQEEILKEFSVNSELSNWFSREDINPPSVVVKKPNPKNVQNTEKIKELEEQIQKLQKQKHSLNALLRSSPIPPIKASKQPDATPNGQTEQLPQPDSIDLSLLEPSQLKLYALIDPDAAKRHSTVQTQEPEPPSDATTLPPITPSTISTRLSRIKSGLAPTLDSLAAGVHDIELYRAMSDNVSSRILRICAERLDEREARKSLGRLALEEQGEQKDLSLRPRVREDIGVILGALSRVERR
ncbi:hypothetical protein P170DRAFT_445150 [Aspergillus steynii IBT 23096]|uniref:Mis12-Mtw1 protein n=1 Tax=Aspergillus steynii IBT 23096 TaxID=1392250 RepID=A0A2I2GKI5_9EURO|nr:uncharacterized protein P170DRAFT_445150 [Aspergillus steynii IBT 23096]PLB53390.1 hypothetical protein P170DRAFT_445150 [Aspergillus steynii IBT 23096]